MNLALFTVGILAFGPVAIIGGLALLGALATVLGGMNFAASTKARYDIPSGAVSNLNFPVAAATKIFQGTLVCVNAAGFLVQAADVAGLTLQGLASLDVDNSGGAAGDLSCPVQPITALKFTDLNADTPVAIWVGKLVYFVDDNTVALVATTANDVLAGKVKEILKTGSAGKVRISLMERVLP